jgi:hypothetical protein
LFVKWESVFGPGADDAALKAESDWVAAGHEGAAGRGANRLDVELVELDAARGESVYVRRFDFGSVVTDIAPAEVIGHDQDDVGAFIGDQAAAR